MTLRIENKLRVVAVAVLILFVPGGAAGVLAAVEHDAASEPALVDQLR